MSTDLTGAAPLVGGPPGPAEAADAYVEALITNGVEVLYLNPGTDTFPIQEAMARLAAQGRPIPQVVLCPHEGVALAAAHGYYAATGRPQAWVRCCTTRSADTRRWSSPRDERH
jgi:thiamine pyrophosphate-dependent acetolactate synthase large subunit-like protein